MVVFGEDAAASIDVVSHPVYRAFMRNEGVIVGRSLDMFISKLRKKLEPDPSISIVVIRGKGYKLEIGS